MCLLRVRSLLLVTFAAAVVAAGCGEGALSSPTAPSALPESTALGVDAPSEDLASATDEFVALGGGKGHGGGSNSGNGGNGGSGKDKEKDRPDKDKSDKGRGGDGESHVDDDDDEGDDDEGEDNHRRRGSLSGFVTAVGTDSITIRGIIVMVTPTTVIRHGHRRLTLAQIAIGDHAQAKGIVSADGKTLMASEIKVEDTGNDNDDEIDDDLDEAEVKGAVAGLPADRMCPTLSFTIGTTPVTTDNATKFDGVDCATLANGTIVEVEGTKQADGSILARKVELEAGPDEVEGKISGLTSTADCPNLTFTVGTTTVTTNMATTYGTGVACATLASGMKVEVEGTLTGTTLAAASIELD